jgi:hypothetical protein
VKTGAAPEDSEDDTSAVSDYQKTFSELVRIIEIIIGLDQNSELPDDIMPESYVEYWL